MTGTQLAAAGTRQSPGADAAVTILDTSEASWIKGHMKYQGPPQSGSIASTTFSRNRYGQYTKARSGGGGPGNVAVADAVAAWQALTDAQRIVWNDFANQNVSRDSLGKQTRLSGFNMFCQQTLSGFVGIEDAPWRFGTIPSSAIVSWVGSAIKVDIVTEPTCYFTTQSSGVVTPGTMSPPGKGKWWLNLNEGQISTSGSHVIDLSSGFVARFGALPASGQYCFVRVRAILRGRWRVVSVTRLLRP